MVSVDPRLALKTSPVSSRYWHTKPVRELLNGLTIMDAVKVSDSGGFGRERPSFVTGLITGGRYREALKNEVCRRYLTTVNIRAHLGRAPRYESRTIIHEIKFRNSLDDSKAGKAKVDWPALRRNLTGGDLRIDGGYITPELIRQELEGYRPKNAYQPDWMSFNHDGIVYMLAAMYAMTTVVDDVSTADFRAPGEKVALVGFVRDDDIRAISSSAVFVPKNCGYFGRGRAFCALVHAAHLAGSKVISDYVLLDKDGCPVIPEVSGGLLAEQCCEALGVLANMYDAAGRGDVFSLACTKGVHAVLTVVGQSDEGAFMRDVLRMCTYAIPRGGIPAKTVAWPGFGLVSAQDKTGMETWVDQIALVTAAAVAHCDPMLTINNKVIPTIINLESKTPSGAPCTDEDYFHAAKAHIYTQFAEFSRLYTHALARCFGFTGRIEEGIGSASGQLQAMFQALVPNRHLKYQVVAPFFWIEPTGMLPRNAFGTDAEKAGSGSLVGPNDSHTMDYLEGAVRKDAPNDEYSQYYVPFTSARNCGLVLLCNGSPNDGLGQAYITQAEPQSFVMTKMAAEDMNAILKENDLGVPLSQLVWTRGQSKICHPAEMVHVDDMILLTLVHCHGSYSRREYYKNVPDATLVLDSKLEIWAKWPQRIINDKANKESNEIKRERTRASVAITTVLNAVQGAPRPGGGFQCARPGTVVIPTQLVKSGRASSLLEAERRMLDLSLRDENENRRGAQVMSKDLGSHKGEEIVVGEESNSKGVALAPSLKHDSLRAPQPFRDAGGQTAIPPTNAQAVGGGVGRGQHVLNAGAQPTPGASPGGC
nr:capsid protein [Totiviridae sp.]